MAAVPSATNFGAGFGGGISAGTAILGGGAISGLSSLIGGGKQSAAISNAAAKQLRAAKLAQQTELKMYKTGISKISPFVKYGQQAIPAVQALTGTGPGATAQSVLTSPLLSPIQTQYPTFQSTVAGVQSSPGYQTQEFIGQTQIKNQLASQGLRLGGAFGTQLAQFETGLNLGTWQAQQQAYLQNIAQLQQGNTLELGQRAQILNALTGQIGTGATAATSALGAAVNTGGQIAQIQQSAGAAGAAASIAQGNVGAGVTNALGGAASNTALLYALNQQGAFGSNPTQTN